MLGYNDAFVHCTQKPPREESPRVHAVRWNIPEPAPLIACVTPSWVGMWVGGRGMWPAGSWSRTNLQKVCEENKIM